MAKSMPMKKGMPKGMPPEGMPAAHAKMAPAEHKKAMGKMGKGC